MIVGKSLKRVTKKEIDEMARPRRRGRLPAIVPSMFSSIQACITTVNGTISGNVPFDSGITDGTWKMYGSGCNLIFGLVSS
jgi:hypothetical protein